MRTATATLLVLAAIALNGCSPPAMPDEERRPAPRAGEATQPPPAIVRSADAFKDRARSAAAASAEAAERERAQIDAQTQSAHPAGLGP